MREPKSILITGASSGIGEALALHYATQGVALALTGRDTGRLEAVAVACRAKGAAVRTGAIDATDAEATAAFIAACDEAAPLDLVIANAGISGGSAGGHESAAQTRRILAVNVDGVIATVLAAAGRMRTHAARPGQPRGQIAIMASLASFRGFPGAPAYCASKAAVRVWGEALRGDLAGIGIEVAVICPGYIRSRMTAENRFPMPLLMDAGRAAQIMAKGLARNRGRIAFPWRLYALLQAINLLPGWAIDRIVRPLPKKAGGAAP